MDSPTAPITLSGDSAAASTISSDSEESGSRQYTSLSDRTCIMHKLFTHTSCEGHSITLRTAILCAECNICNLVEKSRPCSVIPHVNKFLPEEEADDTQIFWGRLNRSINTVYWAALRKNDNAGTRYPVTQMLRGESVSAHYLMDRFEDEKDTKFFFENLERNNDLWFLEDGRRQLNAIQVEEMRFTDALKRVFSHYSKRSYESDMLSRLEALDVAENIISNLRKLLEAEFGCRKEVVSMGRKF